MGLIIGNRVELLTGKSCPRQEVDRGRGFVSIISITYRSSQADLSDEVSNLAWIQGHKLVYLVHRGMASIRVESRHTLLGTT